MPTVRPQDRNPYLTNTSIHGLSNSISNQVIFPRSLQSRSGIFEMFDLILIYAGS